MYPKQKKPLMSWLAEIFVVLSVLLLIGVIGFGIYISQNGSGFRNLVAGKSNGLQLNNK